MFGGGGKRFHHWRLSPRAKIGLTLILSPLPAPHGVPSVLKVPVFSRDQFLAKVADGANCLWVSAISCVFQRLIFPLYDFIESLTETLILYVYTRVYDSKAFMCVCVCVCVCVRAGNQWRSFVVHVFGFVLNQAIQILMAKALACPD